MVYRSMTTAFTAVLLLSMRNGSVIMRYRSRSAAMVIVVDAFQTALTTTKSTNTPMRCQRRRRSETITQSSFFTSSTAPLGRCGGQHHRRRNGVIVNNTLVRMSSSSDYDDNDDDNNEDFFGDRLSSKKQTTTNKQQQQQQQSITKTKAESNDEEMPMSIEELEMLATPIDEHLPQINAVTLIGRVGNDPEPKYFDDGKVVLNLSLAVRRKYHPLERKVREVRGGDEETDWFPLEFWGRDAEYVTNFVEKGTRLGITGSLVMDGWVDKSTGEQRRRPKILVRQIDIVESRAEAELRRSGGSSGSSSSDSGASGGGKKQYRNNNDDEDGGPSPAGTGGFF